jgi:DNA-directed RNA polymerase I, II, and III subunit RPABC2
MSSGIPSLPVAKDDNTDENDDNTENRGVDYDNTYDDSGVDVLSNTDDSDNDETSAAGSISETDDEDDDADVVARAEEGGTSADEGGGDDDGDDDGDGDGDGGEKSKKTKKKSATAAAATRRKKNIEDDMTMLGVPHGIHFEDDENDDDETDEENKDSSEYFQKLKSSVRESYVDTYHPESMSHNYDEIQTLARVIRNNAGVIVDDLHRTIPIMTKYEKTRILGQRARQINEGAPAFIKIDSTVIDGYLIAVKELEQKKTPFIIRRPLPNGGSEYWRVQDLEIL